MNKYHVRRALIIGINYHGSHKLDGCIKDALSLTNEIKKLKYKTLLLLDEKATYKNIVRSLKWLRSGKDLYFHFSGHGSRRGHFLTYDLKPITNELLSRKLLSKVEGKLRITLDCCHSVALFNLRWELKSNGIVTHRDDIYTNYNNSDIIQIAGFNNMGRNLDNKDGGVLTKVLLELLKAKDKGDLTCQDIFSLDAKMKFFNQELRIFSSREISSRKKFLS